MAKIRATGQAARPGVLWLGLALATMLAACATPGPRTRPGAAPPRGPSAAATPVPADQRHGVAVLVPTTGANGALGQSIANAASLALLDSGNQRIRLTVYNTAGGAAAAAQRALADGNRLFLGPLLAEDVRVISPIARAAQVPVLAFSNDADVAAPGTWVLGFQPRQSIARVIAYARSRGVERVGAMIPAGTYGNRVSSALLDAAQDSGTRVTSMVTYTRDAKSMQAAVTKLAGGASGSRAAIRRDGTVARVGPAPAPFDALLVADSGRVVVASTPMLAKAGLGNVRLLGTELWNTEPGLAQVPRLEGAWFAAVPDTTFRQLVTRYRQRFGAAPYRLASLGYDSVLLINRIGARWEQDKSFPVAALTDRGGFSGIDGAFRLRPDGTVDRQLAVQEIGRSGFTTVSPASGSFGN